MWLVDDTSFACWRPVMKKVGLYADSFASDTSSLAVGFVISEHRDVAPAVGAARLVHLDLGKRRELADDRFAFVGADDVIPCDQRLAGRFGAGCPVPEHAPAACRDRSSSTGMPAAMIGAATWRSASAAASRTARIR